jgi:hypothetical protein
MKRQTTENKIAALLDAGGHISHIDWLPRKRDIAIYIFSADTTSPLRISLRFLIQKRYPARPKKKAKTVRRIK